MRLTHVAGAVAALAALSSPLAQAEGVDFKFSGYGTVAGTVVDDSGVNLTRTLNQSKGTGSKLDIGQDSRFGLQGVVNFGKGLSATGQVVAARRATGTLGAPAGNDKDFDPAVEWLYGQYQIVPSLDVRLGRFALPVYLLSDSINVGYAAPWLRAPIHMYRSQPLSGIDGVQVNWGDSFGGVNLRAQASHGQSKNTIGSSGIIQTPVGDPLSAFSLSAEYGNVLVRASVEQATGSVRGLSVKDTYSSLGLQYDDGRAVVMAEYARRSENKQATLNNLPVAKGHYGYVAGGWRFGSLLPLVFVSQASQHLVIPPSGAIKLDQGGPGVGASLRYDVAPNIALKAQVEQYRANDPTVFMNPASDKHDVRSYTAGLDFVF